MVSKVNKKVKTRVVLTLERRLPACVSVCTLNAGSVTADTVVGSRTGGKTAKRGTVMMSSGGTGMVMTPVSMAVPGAVVNRIADEVDRTVYSDRTLGVLLPVVPRGFSLMKMRGGPLSLLVGSAVGIVGGRFGVGWLRRGWGSVRWERDGVPPQS